MGDEEGQISDQLDPQLAGETSQSIPLSMEEELDRSLHFDRPGQPVACLAQRSRVAESKASRPLDPGPIVVRLFEGGERGEFVQPGRLSESLVLATGARTEKTSCGTYEELTFKWDQRSEIDSVPREVVQRFQFAGSQPAVGNDILEVDEERIAGVRRGGLVRRILITGRSDRKHLPIVLAGVCQGAQKPTCSFTCRPYSLGGGQRTDVSQDPAVAAGVDFSPSEAHVAGERIPVVKGFSTDDPNNQRRTRREWRDGSTAGSPSS